MYRRRRRRLYDDDDDDDTIREMKKSLVLACNL